MFKTMDERANTAPYLLAALTLIGIQAAALHHLGQPFIAADGHIKLWESHSFAPTMSQELTDWYRFSHIINGFIFYGLMHLFAPRLPLPARAENAAPRFSSGRSPLELIHWINSFAFGEPLLTAMSATASSIRCRTRP